MKRRILSLALSLAMCLGLIACGAKENMEAKRLLLVRHKEGSEISLILLQLRKGGKPGLKIEEASLFDSAGASTDFYKKVYHLT